MEAGIGRFLVLNDLLDAEEQEDGPIRRFYRREDPFDITDNKFIKLFRLSKDLVRTLIDMLTPFMQAPTRSSALSIEQKVLVALRFFGLGSYQEITGNSLFLGVSQPSVCRCIKEVCNALNRNEILNNWVRFPRNQQNLMDIRNRFYEKYQFPGIVGIIDCTHVAIAPPYGQDYPEHIYINRKHYHSINVQLICDEKLRIMSVDARFPGSCHDAPIWRQSNVSPVMKQIYRNDPNNLFFMLGDSGYYQPAGPLISVSHGHGQPPVQHPPLPKSVPLSDASPTSVSSSVHQVHPPQAPGSNNGDSSDNEVIITSVTSGTKDPPHLTSHQPNASYRYPQYPQYHTYSCPPQYHYQTPPPPTPPYPHHEMCYPTAPPAGYLRHSKYAASPSATYHRYPYYSGHGSELYPSSSAPPVPSQQIVTASPVSASGSYPALNGPPPPQAIMESYPPPPAPPTLVDAYQATPHYYQSAYGLPPTCYSHSPTRAIPYINAAYQHCPCPLNTCPKNGHTGPLTGESKRSNISKDSKPLPPVALALPLEPVCVTGPPSPARGSAGMPSGGMPPPPSPAGANYQAPPVPAPKQESRSPEVSECKVEKRKARIGKANVRNNMQSTMLLMCNPSQDFVKREIESPKDKEELHKKEEVHIESREIYKEDPKIPEACITTTCTKENCSLPSNGDDKKQSECVNECESVQTQIYRDVQNPTESSENPQPDKLPDKCFSPPTEEEPLPPCIATVAENVKVKNMKRKQSQSKEKVPEIVVPPPAKKKKVSSYKDFIRKHTSCFKINNGKRKLVSKASRAQLPNIRRQNTAKRKLNVTKERTNNRRIKARKLSLKKNSDLQSQNVPIACTNNRYLSTKKIGKHKTASNILDNLIAKNNIDRVIDDVINNLLRTDGNAESKGATRDIKAKKSGHKTPKQTKVVNIKASRRKSTTKFKIDVPETDPKVLKKSTAVPKWSNGWIWEGEPYEGKVFINSDETTLIRVCYPSMRHKEGDLIRPGDCVLLKAGPRKNDLPYVAKIAALWENPDDGEMMMSLLWYYRPEHTEQGRLLTDRPDEVFASRHKDSNSVACIDDKCYVLTFNEYCRYKKNFKRIEEGLEEWPRCVPLPDPYPRIRKQPPSSNISPEMVFFCRKVYDFRQKRIIKNPT